MNTAVIALLSSAGTIVAAPIVSAVIVSLASRREDARWTLSTPVRGRLEAAARRIVGFSFQGDNWPQGRDTSTQPTAARRRAINTQPRIGDNRYRAGTRTSRRQ
jgi:hypothetical protein